MWQRSFCTRPQQEALGPASLVVLPLLLCWSTAASHSPVSSTMKNNFCKVDHKTRPEISYNYLRQTKKQASGLGQPAFSSHRHHPGGSVHSSRCCWELSCSYEQDGVGRFRHQGRDSISGSPSSFEGDCQLPQDLVVSPGVKLVSVRKCLNDAGI